jgi:hypothetical protein
MDRAEGEGIGVVACDGLVLLRGQHLDVLQEATQP